LNCAIASSARRLRRIAGLAAAPFYSHRFGIERIAAGHFVHTGLDENSVVLDCGLGDNADFSSAIIARFGSQCYGVDPTRKHQQSLASIACRHGSHLKHVPVALAAATEWMTFYEPLDQISGSLFREHVNANNAVSYQVPSSSFEDLLGKLGLAQVDLLKLDIEGAEYEVLTSIGDKTLAGIQQIVVEFHHYCVPRFPASQTRNTIARLKWLGFQPYSVDGINYLFFR